MKTIKLFSAIAIISIVTLTSCNSNKASSDCDKFLQQYEDYMNKYIEVAKKAQADPTNAELMGEIGKLAQEATKFQTTQPEACKNDKDFLSKFTAIQMKMAANAQ